MEEAIARGQGARQNGGGWSLERGMETGPRRAGLEDRPPCVDANGRCRFSCGWREKPREAGRAVLAALRHVSRVSKGTCSVMLWASQLIMGCLIIWPW
jgi:hypothetical protein